MLRSGRWILIIAAMMATIGLAACSSGDDGDNGGNGDGNGAAAATATEVVDSNDGNGDDDTGDDGVPVPDGADETSSGSFSSSEIPFFVPNADFDADAFTNIEFKTYSVDDSPDDVINFYRDRLGDWDEVFVISGDAAGEAGGFGVWTKGDRAIWVGATSADGGTELVVISGSTE